MIPNWAKSGVFIVTVMIIWDIIRIFIQAKVNKWILKKNFKDIRKDIDELEENVEEVIEDEKEKECSH